MAQPNRFRRVRQETGSAIVELAVVFPLLVLLLAGLADFPRVFFWDVELTNAARAGAQYGSIRHDFWGQTANIQSTASDAAPELSKFISDSDVDVTRACYCASLSSGANLGAVSCNANAATCPGRVVGTLRVGVSATFVRVFKVIPFLPTPYKMGPAGGKPSQAIVRLVP